jgi:hypothetical protein
VQRRRTSGARNPWVAASASVLLLASCGTPEVGETINAQAHGTIYFELGKPAIYVDPVGYRVVGSACRSGQTGLMSPEYVRIEHLSPTGEVIEHVRADLPEMLLRSYQRCSRYSATVAWKFQPDETVNVCFERGRSCPRAGLAPPATAKP